ncbi:unnamed protein product [Phaedon cochleariae]|uniref:LIM zinc-binding domain-containing protein n=1 Tax=Phaedon cochleariae TaxID=80249 RepID=A0A9N9SEM7_PHACE|nr:unnamed protein product [Phaedon cochleariae]
MDCYDHEKDQEREKRTANTEYLPTKCRITKPTPPKPATNPLQFIKVAPCPLFQKAHEQIKKVEEIKKEEKEMRVEVADWQQNLDNWKSSRRKRQEHIIERVVEVKKLTEQEEMEKTRRKSKTFSEMMEERSRGRHKFNIPIYDDDSNDLSDYGIGSSSSKTNSIKDVDTDDSSSILDEKDNHSFDSSSNRENSSASNQSQSEDETNIIREEPKTVNNNNCTKTFTSNYTTSLSTSKRKPEILSKPTSFFKTELYTEPEETKQYTYEGAIQDYRSRIQTINSDDSNRNRNKDIAEVLPKGEIFKRKDYFENKTVDLGNMESSTSRRLSEDFVNTRSIKDRLRSLEQSSDQTSKIMNKSDIQISVKERLQNFNKQNDSDSTNNNVRKANPNKISSFILDKSVSTPNFETKTPKNDIADRCFSPETELYFNKLNMFNRDLDNLLINKNVDATYAPSVCSTEATGVSSDREDSGIHTTDVSCSVSQADEPIDTIVDNKRLEDDSLSQFEKDLLQFQEEMNQFQVVEKVECNNNGSAEELAKPIWSTDMLVDATEKLLDSLRKDSSDCLSAMRDVVPAAAKENEVVPDPLPVTIPKPVIYENVDFKDFITSDYILDSSFPSFVPTREPPKVKPPPPPPPKEEELQEPDPVKRVNSTRRIKKEIHIKRSSFLGLDEPAEEPKISLEKPPELSSFFPKEKVVYQKSLGGPLSKVESQDSGLDIDRGRLSSDTWCSSSVGDSSVPSHERQTSEQTNSITSEEDEITKKEREIIELVEKEEHFRDTSEPINTIPTNKLYETSRDPPFEPTLGSEQFTKPFFLEHTPQFLEEDSEVLRVEQELRQLEIEELERKRDNVLFHESRAKAQFLPNRHSLENIYDKMYRCYNYEGAVDCRKSMPELVQKVQNPQMLNCLYENVPSVRRRGESARLGIPFEHRKSMPDLQHVFQQAPSGYRQPLVTRSAHVPLDHRKSMPELQHDRAHSAFKAPTRPTAPSVWPTVEGLHPQKAARQLGAVPRPKPEMRLMPKGSAEGRNYNQHWVIQEAELRRISDLQKNMASSNRKQVRQCIPSRPISNDRIQHLNRPDGNYKQEFLKHSYVGHQQIINHASPTMTYSPPMAMDGPQERILSVSGKKKCSYCGNELGRGAAMIIESLCLFYHMECFKCCVCHLQLADGMIGTDVRVRNEKLHCHNCYSSDDGVKFSRV